MLDVFNNSAFDLISLTESINLMPYAPSQLGSMGLFTPNPITTDRAALEYKENVISLIPAKARGSMENVKGGATRKMKILQVPYLPLNSAITADDVQGVRAFGSEDQVEGITQLVNNRLAEMRQDHETTWEWHRMGAVNGILLDADGSELVDFFDLYGITQQEFVFDFTDEDSVKQQAQNLTRAMRHALGGMAFTGIQALCGDEFFDSLVKSEAAKTAYNRWNDGAFFRTLQGTPQAGFDFCGIHWLNYDGYFNETTRFIPLDDCRFFPLGAPGLFRVALSPAPFIETVNTPGKAFYAKQKQDEWGTRVDLHTNSSPLHYCVRPQALMRGTVTAGSVSSSSG
jgi:hypothetical protein